MKTLRKIMSLLLTASMLSASALCVFADETDNSSKNTYSASGIDENLTVTSTTGITVEETADGNLGTALKLTGDNGDVTFSLPEAITSGVVEYSFDIKLQDYGTFMQFLPQSSDSKNMLRLHYFYGGMYSFSSNNWVGGEIKSEKNDNVYVNYKVLINLDKKIRTVSVNNGNPIVYDSTNTSSFDGTNAQKLNISFSDSTSTQYGQNSKTENDDGTTTVIDITNVLWIKNVSIKTHNLSASIDGETTDVSVNKAFTVNFNEAVNEENGSFSLKDQSGNEVGFDKAFADNKKSVTVTPKAKLDYNSSYTLTLENIESDYANKLESFTYSFTTAEAKNEVLFDQNTYSAFAETQRNEYVPATDGKKEVSLSRTASKEKVKLSVDLKFTANTASANERPILKAIDSNNSYSKILTVFWDQVKFTNANNGQYFCSIGNLSEYKNITAIFDLENKKVEALYYDGMKMFTGYTEDINFDNISKIEINYNNDYNMTHSIKNLKLETYVVEDLDNTVLFDQHTYSGFTDEQKVEYVPSKVGSSKVYTLDKTVTKEKVKLSVDVKLGGTLAPAEELYGAGPVFKILSQASNVYTGNYYPGLYFNFDQAMFNQTGNGNTYFGSASNFKDYKNITAILDLENKKIEALYFDGEKMTTGYNEALAYDTIKAIELNWNTKYLNDIYIKNLKLETYNTAYFDILKSDIVNGDTSAKLSNKWTYVYFNASLADKY